jgi:D-alanyl-D-alanine carboxypeptidase (penicillin-binding protein 5/6)
MEQSTGKILYENNSHEKIPPASMTKIMSLLLIMENIDKGSIKWNDMVPISKNASSMGGSQILLEENEEMSVKDLVKGISIASGNDAVVAMAEHIAGSEENFVNMMNSKAKSLGLKDTHFVNCHGLDADNHYSSAYDMAHMAKELLNHKEILKFTSIYETYLREKTDKKIWLVNTNKLVRFKKGVDGLKTGYTKTAGYCLTATMQKNGMRLISTVMGEPDASTRNQEVSNMLDYGFSQYNLNNYYKKGQKIKSVPISSAKVDKIDIITMQDVNIITKKNQKIKPHYKIKINKIDVPTRKGEIVGSLKVLNKGKTIQTVDLTVSKDLKKANIIELYWNNLKKVMNGNIN